MSSTGILMSLCGIDGSGKSTYVDFLYETLQENFDVVKCDAMKPSYFNKELRQATEQLQKGIYTTFSSDLIGLSFALDLLENINKIINPALRRGAIVITHRYDLCCLAFSKAMGAETELIEQILRQCVQPDLYFYLDVTPDEAVKRIHRRNAETGIPIQEKEKIDVLSRARDLYFDMLTRKNANVQIINTLLSEESIKQDLLVAVVDLIKSKRKDVNQKCLLNY